MLIVKRVATEDTVTLDEQPDERPNKRQNFSKSPSPPHDSILSAVKGDNQAESKTIEVPYQKANTELGKTVPSIPSTYQTMGNSANLASFQSDSSHQPQNNATQQASEQQVKSNNNL